MLNPIKTRVAKYYGCKFGWQRGKIEHFDAINKIYKVKFYGGHVAYYRENRELDKMVEDFKRESQLERKRPAKRSKPSNNSKARQRRKTVQTHNIPRLTEIQRSTLRNIPLEPKEFEEYLVKVEHLASTTVNRLVLKIESFLNGDTIQYKGWAPFKPPPITDMSVDFSKQREDAEMFERNQAEQDTSNGYLLRIPYRKLEAYQNYLYNKSVNSESTAPKQKSKVKALTNEQRKALRGYVFDDEDFRAYLNTKKLSDANSLALKAKRLQYGEGVEYVNWKERFHPSKGIDGMDTDFLSILKEAENHEAKFGKYKGAAGGLVRTLNKLIEYQRYYYAKKLIEM